MNGLTCDVSRNKQLTASALKKFIIATLDDRSPGKSSCNSMSRRIQRSRKRPCILAMTHAEVASPVYLRLIGQVTEMADFSAIDQMMEEADHQDTAFLYFFHANMYLYGA